MYIYAIKENISVFIPSDNLLVIKFTDALFYRAKFSEGVLGDLFRNEFGELPFFFE